MEKHRYTVVEDGRFKARWAVVDTSDNHVFTRQVIKANAEMIADSKNRVWQLTSKRDEGKKVKPSKPTIPQTPDKQGRLVGKMNEAARLEAIAELQGLVDSYRAALMVVVAQMAAAQDQIANEAQYHEEDGGYWVVWPGTWWATIWSPASGAWPGWDSVEFIAEQMASFDAAYWLSQGFEPFHEGSR